LVAHVGEDASGDAPIVAAALRIDLRRLPRAALHHALGDGRTDGGVVCARGWRATVASHAATTGPAAAAACEQRRKQHAIGRRDPSPTCPHRRSLTAQRRAVRPRESGFTFFTRETTGAPISSSRR
jgi:hypothetical protein